MLAYIVRRILYMIPTLFAISVVAFFVIQLPPGDYLTSMVAGMAAQGETVDSATLAALRERYGLGEPFYVQYYKWISGILLRGDFGQSFEWNRPVNTLIWERLGLTFLLSLATLVFIWLVSFPIGIYSAVRKYSLGDYFATFIGFIGLATPNFLLALVFMYIAFAYFGQSVGGLFSPQYVDAPWSWAKFVDLLNHLWIPMVVLGTSGTASLIRLLRANLLDELVKPYVVTARAKGLSERRLLLKYPVRVALNFFVSAQNNILVSLISGAAIVEIVLSLPTTGPLLLRALTAQDMYLAGSFILMLSVLNVISTLLSDIALAWLDPRIRYR
ncbi:ABC transporter permease [Truepera radiovictrix]|uniref:Binding-protein-dependent transport systems inner membrane component n=1 Tax=Truepera radiovictrix (strain DSM 17093 / CIP 108686 / LMG 22925 / RQ-24) TaxID=649638 RepID=D7CQI4_TRURR|nr:binding-protein-dependent transport systems inner membrane component [Truepera radiovictrix DSM 17093]